MKYYEYGQHQYDRLLPWGAGGALLVSMTLLEKLIQVPAPGTMPILAFGWGALFVALASAIVGHYASSLLYQANWQVLELQQRGGQTPEERAAYWRKDGTTRRMNALIVACNAAAGVGLLAGVALIIWFAYLNLAQRTPWQMI
jgi:hypothetical protein